jgi:hypothetical protein
MNKMTKTSLAFIAEQETHQHTPGPCEGHAPVLITEREVLFSTAAAVGYPVRRNVITMLSDAMTSVVTQCRTRAARRPYYPPRLICLEASLMAREMRRL